MSTDSDMVVQAPTCHSFSASEPQTRPTPAYIEVSLCLSGDAAADLRTVPSSTAGELLWWLLPFCPAMWAAVLTAGAEVMGGMIAGEGAMLAELCTMPSPCTSAERMATANSAAAPEIHPNGPE